MTKDDLDLARARDLYIADQSATQAEAEKWWDKMPARFRDKYIAMARLLRLGDEARGLRVVPVVATKQMMAEGGQVASGYVFEGAKLADDMWDAMLAASPFAPGDGE